MPQAPIATPCQNICKIDRQQKFCLGCFRSLGEIAAWVRLTPMEREAVMAALGPGRDATIEEVRASLAAQGLIFGFGTIQRFSPVTPSRVKRPRTPPNRIAPTS